VIYLARVKGYFAAEHLNVTINQIGGNALAPLLSGQVDIVASGPTGAFSPAKSGKQVSVLINGGSADDAAALVASPKIKDVTQCARIGTGPVGSTVYSWASWWKTTLKLNSDIVPLTDTATLTAGVSSGQIDCGVYLSALFLPAVNAGKLHFLYDPRSTSNFPPSFPHGLLAGALWGLKPEVQAKRDAVIRLLRGILKAVDLMHQLSSAAISVALRTEPDWQAQDQVAIERAYDSGKPFLYPRGGYIPATIWPSEIAFAIGGGINIDPNDAKYSYKQVVDMSYFVAAGGKATEA
jgi:ABC-type nitrate/sulfonate/bicarbonate transport system substrate-binding protein